MNNIKPFKLNLISKEEEETFLSNKLDDRIKYAALLKRNDENTPINQALLYEESEKDWKFFVNNFCWIQDPEANVIEEKDLPFLTWYFQDQVGDYIVYCIENGFPLPVEKCRKLGLSWLVLAILYWGWNFKQWDAIVGSNKFDNVDKKGDMDSLIDKVRYMITKTPKFLMPLLDAHTDKVGLLVHPKHKAKIRGQANSSDFGRGGRAKVAFLDEFAAWEQTDRAAYQSVGHTAKCVLSVSTPNNRGTNCWFYHIVQDHKKNGKAIVTIPWYARPDYATDLRDSNEEDLAFAFNEAKTSSWLENEIDRAVDSQSVAQEILINYEASMAGKVFGGFDMEKQVTEESDYNDANPIYVAWDFGLDRTSMIWIQYNYYTRTFDVIDEYENDGTTQDGSTIYHYLDVLDSKPYKKGIHYGDPNSGVNRSITSGQSPAMILRRQGIIFKCQKTAIKNRIAAARNILPNVRIHPRCTLAIEMFSSWQLVKPKSGNTISNVPDHSTYSHIGEAFTYFAWNHKQLSSPSQTQQKPRKTYGSVSGVNL